MEGSNQTSQIQQPTNPTPPVVNSGKSKVVPIILGIVTAIILAIAAFALGSNQSQPVVQTPVQTTPIPSPTPIDETANWKTYTNTKYDYSIKYPQDWRNDDDPKSPSNDPSSVGFRKIGAQAFEAVSSIGIVIIKNPKNLTLNEWIKDSNNKNSTIIGVSADDLIITQMNNYKAYKLTSKTSDHKNDIVYFIENNKIIYEIYLSIIGQFQEETKSAFDQILSTFKFTP